MSDKKTARFLSLFEFNTLMRYVVLLHIYVENLPP